MPPDANAMRIYIMSLLVRQPDPRIAAEVLAVVIRLQSRRANAMGGKLLVALFEVAGDADRADPLARLIPDLQAATLGENLVASRALEVAHEHRLLLGAHLHELGRSSHRQRR